jgi:predicted DNA-binding transcriptional regulator AlpA
VSPTKTNSSDSVDTNAANRAKNRNDAKKTIERRFISESELEILTGVSKRTWQKHRLFGHGPRFYRLCGAVRYDLAEVLEWIEGNAAGGDGRGRAAAVHEDA